MSSVLLAVGGNALVLDNEKPTIAAQMERTAAIARTISELVDAGHSVTVTHGNGPQVGFIMRRAELLVDDPLAMDLPELPLWLAVADSQGGIGHMLTTAIHSELRARGLQRNVTTVITHCLVDRRDPAFAHPDKPIGSVLPAPDANPHWHTISPKPGYVRRVVPSPEPIDILESAAIATLMSQEHIVVAGGGGGIPVVDTAGQLSGIDAVIDKDRTSALLANQARIETLVLLTGVANVAVGWGTPDERTLEHTTAAQMRQYLSDGEFPAGSMGPKIEAALSFLDGGGSNVIITDIPTVTAALAGNGGTHITKE